ncbi:hypothetical protein [Dyadobacter bucti]|uniref:hypothetical protein n=1 Tax=Dyadobacter bucti TaxID=2572203 RepID=UPI0011086AA5|nr:hypothetical protein [Dyadobacter bucti]
MQYLADTPDLIYDPLILSIDRSDSHLCRKKAPAQYSSGLAQVFTGSATFKMWKPKQNAMFYHVKELQCNARVSEPDPKSDSFNCRFGHQNSQKSKQYP